MSTPLIDGAPGSNAQPRVLAQTVGELDEFGAQPTSSNSMREKQRASHGPNRD